MNSGIKRSWYSVLIVYDESVSDGFDTFYTWELAASPKDACGKAIERCKRHNRLANYCDIESDALHIGLIVKGKRYGLDRWSEKP